MSKSTTDAQQDYYALTPDTVLSAVSEFGFNADARIFPLNSYENRVYQIGIEDSDPIIGKFYRPGRWSDEAIMEEHHFTQQLSEQEIPVVAPISIAGQTLLSYHGYRFALYPRKGGQAPEPGDLDQLNWLGRLLGRIHNIGKSEEFHHRPTINSQTYGEKAAQFILQSGFLPAALEQQYADVSQQLATQIKTIFSNINSLHWIRGHGDFHHGNILWHRDQGPWLVDFDDCSICPAVQDIWMLLSGSRHDQSIQLSELLDGYSDFCPFDPAELKLVEPLRALRLIHYHAWLAKRWQDPAFPANFPWFNSDKFWQQHITDLQNQLVAINSDPLKWY